ncbi:hypothetical protein [Actinoplanes philippinensis]|uniref:hypothetical protein n=1 Tax=Actinoplanes philippinensis TaxID=35752 RepID=UPI0033F91EB3
MDDERRGGMTRRRALSLLTTAVPAAAPTTGVATAADAALPAEEPFSPAENRQQ